MTSPSTWGSSPGRTGNSHRKLSTPIPISGGGPNGRTPTAKLIAMPAVCQPEAANPLNKVWRAAASSRCIGCGSNSAANRLMSSSVTLRVPLLNFMPSAKSSNHSIISDPRTAAQWFVRTTDGRVVSLSGDRHRYARAGLHLGERLRFASELAENVAGTGEPRFVPLADRRAAVNQGDARTLRPVRRPPPGYGPARLLLAERI